MDEVLGFIGLGKMGAPMTRRLLAAGRKVIVADMDAAVVSALVSDGAQAATSAAQVAAAAHTVFLSLPTPASVLQVVTGPGGLIEGKAVRYVVDFSTIGPRAASTASAALKANGAEYIDAPVSGGVAGAHDGKLAVMVACPTDVYAAVEPLMTTFGKLFHVGERVGQAQIMKLANNLLNVAAVALSSEAMVMGVKAGLKPELMLEIINAGTGRNSATLDKFPRSVLPGTFDYGFATGLSYKDVGLCVDEAEALGVPMVVGAAVRQLLAITNATCGPASDFTSICRVVEGWAGVEVRGPSARKTA